VYHEFPTPGKIAIAATKQLVNQHDLALAYSPGVAAPCEEIVKDPNNAFKYTSRGNLVAVITNGTAVLGLGDIGPLAAKPVMEGKGVLFKKFAGIDVFDIEINEKARPGQAGGHHRRAGADLWRHQPGRHQGAGLLLCRAQAARAHEDPGVPRRPARHGHRGRRGHAERPQGGRQGPLQKVKLVTSGAGAAALACLGLLVKLGLAAREHLCDRPGRRGLRGPHRTDGRRQGGFFAQNHHAPARWPKSSRAPTCFWACPPAACSSPTWCAAWRPPLIFALANPTPEILPEEVKAVRDDAIMATGRTDYPNQVNNVLCFPYIFRGALDAGASTITLEMEIAAVHAIAELAQAEQSEVVAAAYAGEQLAFGPEYLIPKPFDPRLMMKIAPAVARAAADSGVATASDL
jgi:malate dehydrogenase (oxaloacetate-decarboxylating)(NADP+)